MSLFGSSGTAVIVITDSFGSDVPNSTWLPVKFVFCVAGKHATELFAAQVSAIVLPFDRSPVASVGVPAATLKVLTDDDHPAPSANDETNTVARAANGASRARRRVEGFMRSDLV